MDTVSKTELSFFGFLKRRQTLDVVVSLWRNVAASVAILGLGLGFMCKTVDLVAMIAAGVVQLIALTAIGLSLQLAYLSLRETLGENYALTRKALRWVRLLAVLGFVLIVGSGYVLLVYFIGSAYWDNLWLVVAYLLVLVGVCALGLRDWQRVNAQVNQKKAVDAAADTA